MEDFKFTTKNVNYYRECTRQEHILKQCNIFLKSYDKQ